MRQGQTAASRPTNLSQSPSSKQLEAVPLSVGHQSGSTEVFVPALVTSAVDRMLKVSLRLVCFLSD